MLKNIKEWIATICKEEVRSLRMENLILQQQLSTYKFKLKKKPKLTRFDRVFWVFIINYVSNWRDLLVIVKPETVIGWHKKGFKLFWKIKSRGGTPSILIEHINLIKKMARENPWGAPRIQGELKYLGIHYPISTISKYMPKIINTRSSNQSWMTFLKNHMGETISMDIFVVPSILFRPIHGLVVMSHKTREIIFLKLMESSNQFFVISQLKEILWDSKYKYLIRDNDSIYGGIFKEYLTKTETIDSPTSFKSPWQNCYCERVIGTIRKELLDKVVVVNLSQGNKLLDDYKDFYNEFRPHQGTSNDTPLGREITSLGEVNCDDFGNGLFNVYSKDRKNWQIQKTG